MGPEARVVVLGGAVTLTHEFHAGRILLMSVDPAAATTFTLPEAAGTGHVFHFRVGIVNTSNYVIASAGSDLMDGSLTNISTTADNEEGFQAANAVTITLDGDAQGGFRNCQARSAGSGPGGYSRIWRYPKAGPAHRQRKSLMVYLDRRYD